MGCDWTRHVTKFPFTESVTWKKQPVYNGVRVQMGLHYGPVESLIDPVTKQLVYLGPNVVIPATLCASAAGGEIRMTRPVFLNIAEIYEMLHRPIFLPLGTASLRGAPEVYAYTMMPRALEAR